MRSNRLVQIFLGVIIVALVAAGISTYGMIRERQKALQEADPYDITYTAQQAAIELYRFESALLQLDRDRTEASLEEARLRFEILYNRIGVLGEGDFARFVAKSPARQQIVTQFRAAVRGVDPILTDAGIDLNIDPVLAMLRPFNAAVLGLAAEANESSAAEAHEDRLTLSGLQERFSGLTFGLILCGFCLVSVLTWHNSLLARAHRKLAVTALDLEKAASDLSSANEAVAAVNRELRAQNRRLLEKEDALRARNMLFDTALNNMSQGLCMFDGDLRPLVCNTRFEQLFGARYSADADAAADYGRAVSLRQLMPELAPGLEANIRNGGPAEFEAGFGDGRVIAIAQQPMSDGGWVATFADVTEQRRTHARIAHMARHDGLTDLPNRYAFRERIEEALDVSRASGSMLAVMCLDLDHFKEVNDTLGHPTGDSLLCAVAKRLAGCVRETDMVARFGGDEFAILQEHVERFDDAERLATRLIDEIRRPFLIGGELVYTTASLGIAISPKHGNDAVVLQKNADLALYAAKANGRRTYRFFESEMDELVAHRHVLERDLRQAIPNGQLHLRYQPIVHLRTMQTIGFEALLRWAHPVYGWVPPSKFIPVAEDAGLITNIGRWVLAQACADAAHWPAHLKLSVNLSAAQFTQADIVQDISEALSRAGLRPERLVVEITESLLLAESITTLNTLHRLKTLGIEVAMDDFGTGYSSLSYLRKYPFDRIKIDRDFVTAGQGDKNVAIIRTIVQLGAALGMTTVAEGVETEEDLAMLIAAGCPQGQGYLFSDAVPADKVFDIINAAVAPTSRVA